MTVYFIIFTQFFISHTSINPGKQTPYRAVLMTSILSKVITFYEKKELDALFKMAFYIISTVGRR